MGSTYRRIEAVSKTCAIIKYLATQKQPTTGADISAAVGEKLGTVMCHLATLQDAGFVQQVSDGWQLGMGLALIWARVKSNLEGQRERVEQDLESISIRR